MLKKDLIKENEQLKLKVKSLEAGGTVVSGCHIDMNDDSAIEIAKAVKEAMIALQNINKFNKYGVYVGKGG